MHPTCISPIIPESLVGFTSRSGKDRANREVHGSGALGVAIAFIGLLEKSVQLLNSLDRVCRRGKHRGPYGELGVVRRLRKALDGLGGLVELSARHGECCEVTI